MTGTIEEDLCFPRLADEAAMERASRIFRALGDGPRLRLLVRLAARETCVSDVAKAEREEISTISQRLRVLRNEGLVSRRRQGKRIVYGLADEHVADLIRNALAHASEPGRYLTAIQKTGEERYVPSDTHR